MEITIIPKFVFAVFKVRIDAQFHLNVFFTALLITVVPFTVPSILKLLAILPHVCIFKFMFGIQCPGCGFVRSFTAISQLDWYSAWSFNAFAVLLYLLSVIQVPLRAAAIAFPQTRSHISTTSRLMSTMFATCFIIWWIFRALMEYQ